VQRDGYINKLRNYQDKVVERILDDLFYPKGEKRFPSLTFSELNKRFDEDKFVNYY
jgi:hypothetical protein